MGKRKRKTKNEKRKVSGESEFRVQNAKARMVFTQNLKKFDWWNMGFDALVVIGLLVYSVAVWWPTRYLPYHWNSASFVVNATVDLMQRNYSPLVLQALQSSHPPLFMVILGLAWKLFGQTRLVSHSVMLPTLPLLLMATYLLGKKLSSRLVGILAAFLMAMMPTVVSEYGVMSVDLMAACVTSLAMVVFLHKRRVAAMILLVIAVWIEGVVIGMIVMMAGWLWLTGKRKSSDYYWLGIPIASWLLWVVYHVGVAGWWLSPPGRPFALPHVIVFGRYLWFVVVMLLTSHRRWLLTLSALGLAGIVVYKKSLTRKQTGRMLALGLGVAVIVLWLALRGSYVESSSLIIMPYVVVMALIIVRRGLMDIGWYKAGWSLVGVGLVVGVGWLMQWQPTVKPATGYVWRRQADLSYQDLILIGREAAIFAETNYPHAKVYGGYPESYQLTQPYQGYVTGPLDFALCSDYEDQQGRDVLLYLHPYHPTQQACKELLDEIKLIPLTRLESNGMWLELYSNTATPTAQLAGE